MSFECVLCSFSIVFRLFYAFPVFCLLVVVVWLSVPVQVTDWKDSSLTHSLIPMLYRQQGKSVRNADWHSIVASIPHFLLCRNLKTYIFRRCYTQRSSIHRLRTAAVPPIDATSFRTLYSLVFTSANEVTFSPTSVCQSARLR